MTGAFNQEGKTLDEEPGPEPVKQKSDFTEWMSRHLVGLAGTYFTLGADGKPIGEERVYCFSGFIIVLYHRWCYVTAGHNLAEVLGEYVEKNWIRINRYYFLNSSPHKGKCPW